mgnify:CR=1 FL=1
MSAHTYLAIDLKSFYASVECRERGLDPLDTNLVVADERRTDKTICLAVTPSLKSYGISGRGRLFEVRQRVREANIGRRHDAPGHQLSGSSFSFSELQSNPSLAVDFIIAPPRMAYYMEYSNRIYSIYMKYVAPEDIVVYSIDEVFMDVTGYLNTYGLTAHELAMKIILDVLNTTGITATAGIGTNLYLAKIAMDIEAKHTQPDANGVRIAELDEMSYRKQLWSHRPLTDFWRIGRGYERKLESAGLYTMGDIARCSLHNEDKLYQLFGVNAELLIDHAWGWEPCTIAEIKAYRPRSSSISSGQVLQEPYPNEKARLIVREMADQLSLELVEKGLVCSQFRLDIDYDTENLSGGSPVGYRGPVKIDRYGRKIPAPAHGSTNLETPVSSSRILMQAAARLFDQIAQPALSVRKITVTAAGLLHREDLQSGEGEQLDFFGEFSGLYFTFDSNCWYFDSLEVILTKDEYYVEQSSNDEKNQYKIIYCGGTMGGPLAVDPSGIINFFWGFPQGRTTMECINHLCESVNRDCKWIAPGQDN